MKHNLNPEQLLMLCKGETVEIDGKKIHITDVTSDVASEPQQAIQPVWDKYPIWYKLGRVEGYYIYDSCSIIRFSGATDTSTRNTFRTEAQCKFALAAAQLSQLVHKWNEEYGEEWGEEVYCITYDVALERIVAVNHHRRFESKISSLVTFKTEQLAEKFIELNTPLLKDFFMLND